MMPAVPTWGPPEPVDVPQPSLVVAPDGAWFKLNGQRVEDLATRQALRRMLLSLAETRIFYPEKTLSPKELFETGWPGERATAWSAATRVYTAIHTLRHVYGLEGILRRKRGGYFLDALVRVAAMESQFPIAANE